MAGIYVRLDVVAHMIGLQQIKEDDHRKKNYAGDPAMIERLRLEQSSALAHAFSKILAAVEMSHEISEHTKKSLCDRAWSAEGARKNLRHYILKED